MYLSLVSRNQTRKVLLCRTVWICSVDNNKWIWLFFVCHSALPKIIKTGFSAINLIYFFTAGPDEVMFLSPFASHLLDVTRLIYFKKIRSLCSFTNSIIMHFLNKYVMMQYAPCRLSAGKFEGKARLLKLQEQFIQILREGLSVLR